MGSDSPGQHEYIFSLEVSCLDPENHTRHTRRGEVVQPFINISKHFQMLSEISSGDLDTIRYSIGITEPDNWKSKIYNGSTSAAVTNKAVMV